MYNKDIYTRFTSFKVIVFGVNETKSVRDA